MGFWHGACVFRYRRREQWGRGVCKQVCLGKVGGNRSIWHFLPQITFTEWPLHLRLRKFCSLGCLGFWQNCTKGNCSIISWWLHDTLDPNVLECESRFGVPREKSGLLCLLPSQCTKSGPNLIFGRNHYQSIIKIAFFWLWLFLLYQTFVLCLFFFIVPFYSKKHADFTWGDVERPLFIPDTETPNRSRKGFYPNQIQWAE